MPGVPLDEPDPPRGKSRRRSPRAFTTSRITTEGVLFVGLALLIGLAAVNTGANLLYLVLSMMLAMIIISWLISRINLRRLVVRRRYPLEFHAGQAVQGVLEAYNGKLLFYSYAIGLRDAIHGPLQGKGPARGRDPRRAGREKEALALRTFAIMIAPRRRTSCPVRLNLPERGLYSMRHVGIVSRFPFGFFEKMRHQDEIGKILVYPRLLPAVAVLARLPRAFGELEVERKGHGAGIFGVRDYQSGDPARHIHWKLSAKGHGLKLKEYEQEESRSYRLMLDLRCPARPSAALLEDFEKALSVAATLARLLLRQDAAVALWATTGNIPLSTGFGHMQRIMRALAQIEPLPPDARPVPPDIADQGVAEIWIEYQGKAESPGQAEDQEKTSAPAIRRAPRHYVIDARKVSTPEEDPR